MAGVADQYYYHYNNDNNNNNDRRFLSIKQKTPLAPQDHEMALVLGECIQQ